MLNNDKNYQDKAGLHRKSSEACHNINGPGINGLEGQHKWSGRTIYVVILGPAGPLICIDIYGQGKT